MKKIAALLTFSLLVLGFSLPASADGYDPFSKQFPVKIYGTQIADKARNREIPVRIYYPAGVGGAVPVLLFSHAIGGSRDDNDFLGQHWAARGYVAVFLQHSGSDARIWKSANAELQKTVAMKKATSPDNFLNRNYDIQKVLDTLPNWNASPTHPLYGLIDSRYVGVSGYSYGAVTAMTASDQTFLGIENRLSDSRIDAMIGFSPSLPKRSIVTEVLQNVDIPWLVMIGTKDMALMLEPLSKNETAFAAKEKGGAYEFILGEAEHASFTDNPVEGEPRRRNPNHFKLMLGVSTAFWDAKLKHQKAAEKWLDGYGSAALLQEKDTANKL